MKAHEVTWPLERPARAKSPVLKRFLETAEKAGTGFVDKWRSLSTRHPLLQACRQADYGQIEVTTPQGKKLLLGNPANEPKVDWQIHNWDALDTILGRGEMGMAETYVTKQWDSRDLPALLTYGLKNAKALERYFYGNFWFTFWAMLRNLFKKNTLTGSRQNVLSHYDLGNEFYALWLDKGMTYSCGLFQGQNRTLEEAQAAKYQRILDKLALPKGAHVLDIGCGWGGFAEAAARQGLRVTGITLSDAQKVYAVARMWRNKLDGLADIQLCDYREVMGEYDGIASIGMFEHVGMDYWPAYFQTVKNRLKPGAKAMIQCIALSDDVFERVRGKFGFIEQVIFPGGVLPSIKAFKSEVEKAGLTCLETFTFGHDYARTLHHWLERFEASKDILYRRGYDEFFIRLWRFYLASCIAAFNSERTSVMQAELINN